MRRRFVLAAVVLLAPLAGCLGGDEASSERGDPANEAANETDQLRVPSWSIGDYWTWSTDQQGEVTYVVTGEEGSNWIVDTTNRGVAFFDARFPVSTLGEIRKSDLAGSQGDQRVAFFDWPMETGKTWTTTWDGVERTIRIQAVDEQTARLDATQDGRLAVQYTYDSEVESFRTLHFLDENGTETFGMELTDHGSDFGEPAIRWELANPLDETGTFGAQPTSWNFDFEVEEGASDIWLDLAIDCPSGTFQFGFRGEQDGYSRQENCPAEAAETGPVVEAPPPGSYDGGFTAASPDGEGDYSITLYVRTLLEVPVGEG